MSNIYLGQNCVWRTIVNWIVIWGRISEWASITAICITESQFPTDPSYGPDPKSTCLFDNLKLTQFCRYSKYFKQNEILTWQFDISNSLLEPNRWQCDHSSNRLDSLTTFRYSPIHSGWRMVPWCNGRTGEKNIVSINFGLK